MYLGFKKKEMNNIAAQPLLLNGAPHTWLNTVLSDWMEWAPGDSRGSTKYANLEDLRSAVSKAGFGVVAAGLSLKQETGQSDGNKRKVVMTEDEPVSKKLRLAKH